MHRSLVGKDVCFFCALQLDLQSSWLPSRILRPRRSPHPRIRSYSQHSRPLRYSAQAAALQEDDDEPVPCFPSPRITSTGIRTARARPPHEQRRPWHCPNCRHKNFPRETQCFRCGTASPFEEGHRQSSSAAQFNISFPKERNFRSTASQGHEALQPLQGQDRSQSRPGMYTAFAGRREQTEHSRSLPQARDFQGAFRRDVDAGSALPTDFPFRAVRSEGSRRARNGGSVASGFNAFEQAVRQERSPRSSRQPLKPSRAPSASNHPAETRAPSEGPDMPIGARSAPIAEQDLELDDRRRRHSREELSREDKRSSRLALDDAYEEAEERKPPPARKISKKGRQQSQSEREDADDEYLGEDQKKKKRKKKTEKTVRQPLKSQIEIPEFISVQQLAQSLGVRLEAFTEKLEEEGFESPRHDHVLDSETSAMFADLYGFEPIFAKDGESQDLVARPPTEDRLILPPRPPIVTIMGHVDHGKTTILDWLRKSSIVESEHGGITQHIGAFSFTMPGTQRKITFLDTPGHAAFLDMRRRGANVTDIVVLVVAADDSVKPQTIEAIKHAKEAGVPIIVAINKVDKYDANIPRVKDDLLQHDIIVEDYQGDIQAIPLSGKTGQGMEALEEAIVTLADVSDFRAETDGPAEGWIIESKVTSAGRVATVLVRRGTLQIGDYVVAGNTWARVRTLRNDAGLLVSEAGPGTPVQVDGWRGEDPSAGLEVLQAEGEEHAKEVIAIRMLKEENLRSATDMTAINAARAQAAEARAKVIAWQAEQGYTGKRARKKFHDNEGWVEKEDGAGPKRVHLVVKADVAGSAEAVVTAVEAVGNNEVKANVIHSGTGPLTESDIRMLATTGEIGYAISFNQPVEGTVYRLAEAAGLQILDHNIIYKVTDDVKEKLSQELPPLVTQKVLGEAEVGQVFDISLKKSKIKVAGCRVTNGSISRSQKVRVVRGDEVVYTGTLDSLKNVKKDVTEMRKGSECGMSFDDWDHFQVGDKIQCFEEIQEKRKLY